MKHKSLLPWIIWVIKISAFKWFLLSEKFKTHFASLDSVKTYNEVSFVTFQDNIPDAMLKKLKKYIDNPKFTPENVEKVSKVGYFSVFSFF